MTHTRIIRQLAVLLVLGILGSGCALQQHDGNSPQTVRPDAQQQARFGEALFTIRRQRAGGSWSLDPELAAYVSGVGTTLARLSERPALDWRFVVLNESAAGAWAFPGGKVAVTRGLLLALDDEAELAALLLLALEHVLHGADIDAQSMLGEPTARLVTIGTARDGAQWYEITLRTGDSTDTAHEPPTGAAAPSTDEAALRQLERAGYDPQALLRLLQHLCAPGGETDRADPDFAIHRCTEQRLEAAGQGARRLGTGERGLVRFQERTRRLRRDAAAYTLHASALDALAAGDNERALGFAAEALRLQPREALFHELRAVAAWRLTRPAVAFSALNRAIALDPDFFRPHLLRGLLHLVHGNLEPAAEDLLAANRLLPTVEATLGLAEVARGLGDAATAARRYAAVADGHSAAAAFARKRAAEPLGGAPAP